MRGENTLQFPGLHLPQTPRCCESVRKALYLPEKLSGKEVGEAGRFASSGFFYGGGLLFLFFSEQTLEVRRGT